MITTQNETLARILPRLESLTPEQLAEVEEHIDDLHEAVELTQEEWEQSWTEEVEQRIADIESGRVKTIPGHIAMKELREEIRCWESNMIQGQ